MILSTYHLFIALSGVSGTLIFFRKNTPIHLRLLTLFLFVTLAVEMTATYRWEQGLYTTQLYNYFIIFQFEFNFYLLYAIIHKASTRSWIQKAGLIFFLFSIINLFLFQGMDKYNSITYALGCLFVVGFSVSYFYQLFANPVLVNILHESSFWLAAALLFYFACSFPLITLVNFMSNLGDRFLSLIASLLSIMNYFLYLLFSIAFLCQIKIRKYSL